MSMDILVRYQWNNGIELCLTKVQISEGQTQWPHDKGFNLIIHYYACSTEEMSMKLLLFLLKSIRFYVFTSRVLQFDNCYKCIISGASEMHY